MTQILIVTIYMVFVRNTNGVSVCSATLATPQNHALRRKIRPSRTFHGGAARFVLVKFDVLFPY